MIQVLTIGALHQADSAALRSAASSWHAELAPLPKPLLVVNIGGPSGKLLHLKIGYAFPFVLFIRIFVFNFLVCNSLRYLWHLLLSSFILAT